MLMNYVGLNPGIPRRMHFTDDYLVDRDIWDPQLGRSKRVRSLVFWVDELDGENVARTFSILSTKLQQQLQPFLEGKEYTKYDFVITEVGEGFTKDFLVEPILRRE